MNPNYSETIGKKTDSRRKKVETYMKMSINIKRIVKSSARIT